LRHLAQVDSARCLGSDDARPRLTTASFVTLLRWQVRRGKVMNLRDVLAEKGHAIPVGALRPGCQSGAGIDALTSQWNGADVITISLGNSADLREVGIQMALVGKSLEIEKRAGFRRQHTVRSLSGQRDDGGYAGSDDRPRHSPRDDRAATHRVRLTQSASNRSLSASQLLYRRHSGKASQPWPISRLAIDGAQFLLGPW